MSLLSFSSNLISRFMTPEICWVIKTCIIYLLRLWNRTRQLTNSVNSYRNLKFSHDALHTSNTEKSSWIDENLWWWVRCIVTKSIDHVSRFRIIKIGEMRVEKAANCFQFNAKMWHLLWGLLWKFVFGEWDIDRVLWMLESTHFIPWRRYVHKSAQIILILLTFSFFCSRKPFEWVNNELKCEFGLLSENLLGWARDFVNCQISSIEVNCLDRPKHF